MKTELHTVTIPISDYNELIKVSELAEEKIAEYRGRMTESQVRSREFVSALAFLEEKGLLDEFNAKISKSYKLREVGKDVTYKQLIEP